MLAQKVDLEAHRGVDQWGGVNLGHAGVCEHLLNICRFHTMRVTWLKTMRFTALQA